MALFLSTYVNKLDAKGRVSIPASFRPQLTVEGFSGVVLFCSPKHKCLEGFDMKAMEDMAARLDQFDMFSSQQDDMAASLFGAAQPLTMDGQGRVILPNDLIEYAGLTDRVSIVGLGRKFQFWNPDEYAARQEQARKNVEDGGMTLPARSGAGGERDA